VHGGRGVRGQAARAAHESAADAALPAGACTAANGCFRKVNQSGQAGPLPADQGWGVEIALDLDMVSAACPDCKILLVESDSATLASLGSATG
jgi:hypothetical protein